MDERQCRSYLTLAVETVEMFHYLTEKIKKPFLAEVSNLSFFLIVITIIIMILIKNDPKQYCT